MPLNVTAFREHLAPYLKHRRWLVAYSGGVDSHVLLHLLAQLKQNFPALPELLAVHVDHQLQADSSAHWVDHCRQQAQQLGVPISVHEVEISCVARESLEDKARQARYDVFEQLLQSDDVLLLGHHLDDQIETLVLRLLRGSGSKGLSAMPRSRALGAGQLFRPLLNSSRDEIEQYANEHALDWVEDESNQSEQFDRNYLRHQVLPLIEKRWSGYRQPLARSVQLSHEAAQLNTELAQLDMKQLGMPVEASSLPIDGLKALSELRQKNLLRFWIDQRKLISPSAQQLQAVIDQVIDAAEDAEPLLQWSKAEQTIEVRRFRGRLFLMLGLPSFDNAVSYDWDFKQPLVIEGVGTLSFTSGIGDDTPAEQGLSKSLLEQSRLTVCFRQGGERCQPYGRAHSQSLKKLFQEYHIEPWLRDRTPLLYINDELAAVAGYWMCAPFVTSSESVLQLTLLPE